MKLEDAVTFALSLLLLAAFASFWVARRLKLRNARGWTMCTGSVYATNLRMERTGGEQHTHVAEVSYSYRVGGHVYSGRLSRSFLLHGSAKRWLDVYQTGRSVVVRYNPQKVYDSVLLEREQPMRVGMASAS